MQRFYLVWDEDTGFTRKRHLSEVEARKEAERLASENSGKSFHVLTSLAACCAKSVQWDEVPELPF